MKLLLATPLHLAVLLFPFVQGTPVNQSLTSTSLQSRDVSENQPAHIVITTFSDVGCSGSVTYSNGINYAVQNPTSGLFKSIKGSRALAQDEKLDFSTLPVSEQGSIAGKRDSLDYCGLWKSSVIGMDVTVCHDLTGGVASCLRLLQMW